MAVTPNTTLSTDIQVRAREIDFVTQFDTSWQSLREILGIMRPIRKQPGTVLSSLKTTVELADGNVAEGDEIPLSKATIETVYREDLKFLKYDKRVTIENVDQHGATIAIALTDEEMRNEIQSNILDDFYKFAATGTLTSTEGTFQMAVAMAIGSVRDKFKKMRKNASGIVVFVNTLDVYKYLGSAEISVQNSFGMDYIQNFMGASTVILSSEIERGKVIATATNNINLYYADPSDSEYRQLGLDYTTSGGETNLIGFHAEPVYNRASGDTFAIYAIKLWAEYLDGIAVVSISGATGANAVSAQSEDGATAKTAAAKAATTKS